MPEGLTLEAMYAELQAHKQVSERQALVIAALTKKKDDPSTETKKVPEIPKEPVEVNGKKYKFQVATFRIAGDAAIYTAEEAVLDEELLSQILGIEGQGMLKEVL